MEQFVIKQKQTKSNKVIILIHFVLFFATISSTTYSFEAFPQPHKTLFLCPYMSFGWKNAPYSNSNGSHYQYNDKDKITSMYLGLFTEYGLTKNITIGFDTYFAESWTGKIGKIALKPQDKAFSLDWLSLFGRYNFVSGEHFFMSVYTALNFPKFGTGTGRLDTFGKYGQWQNLWRIEMGWKFKNGNYFTINFGYQANYGYKYDIFEFKMTNLLKFPYDIMLYSFFKKQAYINKGNHTYAFAQNDIHWNALNFITNGGYTSIGFYLGKKIIKKPNVIAVIAYTRSLNAKIFCNEKMNINSNTFWFEFWIII